MHETLTVLLDRAASGDARAREVAFVQVYDELRGLARELLAGERRDHTLQPTALVNEVALRLLGQRSGWSNREHFFALASMAMRRVLVDHARAHLAAKRGRGKIGRLAIEPAADVAAFPAEDVLALDELLDRLKALDERKARVVELRYFAGLGNDEVADVLGVARSTVAADWAFARAWLAVRLNGGDGTERRGEQGAEP